METKIYLVCDKREFRAWFEKQYPVFAKTYKDTPEGATFRIQMTEFALVYMPDNGHYEYIFTVAHPLERHKKIGNEFIDTVHNTFEVEAPTVPDASDIHKRIFNIMVSGASTIDAAKSKKPNLQILERATIYRHLSPWIKSLKVRPTAKDCMARIKEQPTYKNKKITRQRMEKILSEGMSGAYDEILKSL